jgi:hypothetical protein
MATLVLGAVGSAVGGPLGGALGSIAGSLIDSLVLAPLFAGKQTQKGPRLKDLNYLASVAGAPMPRVWGKMRLAPQVIWATKFKETTHTKTKDGIKTVEYLYSVSVALGLCEGEVKGLGRQWADGKLFRLGDYTARFYSGSETQTADPKIVAIEGADATPAFRGTAYLVLEDLPLKNFSNRVPQLTSEAVRVPTGGKSLEDTLRAVTIIPATTEFGYATTQITKHTGLAKAQPVNSQASGDAADIVIALDQLQADAPQVEAVSLVIAWHGTDLRAGNCELRPKVESASTVTRPYSWKVGSVNRGTAQIVSTYNGAPAWGGAPTDRSIYEAIIEIKNRGFEVMICPLIAMDIAAGNTLPNPYSNNAATLGQPAYPWRGKITCSPAAGFTGSVDKTATAATQIASFFGTAVPGNFNFDNNNRWIDYSGPAEWSYRRFVLHLAHIAAAAGGVDRFLLGSELAGLTQVRSSASAYPAVTQLISLAADVASELPGADISYAADWSEYHSHRPSDGTNDVYFNLDPLWADANIDFVGIDNYLPLADWRAGNTHLDKLAGWPSIYDQAYLQSNIEGGEFYTWYYVNGAARDAQTRTTITDGAYGKPWVFRNKDIRNWWLNAHYNRPAGVQSGSPTAWVAQGKPILFTELGCPAIDKGANQPNTFVDPKSSSSALPYYSTGRRDDLMQRAAITALLQYWAVLANNPISAVYGGRMLHTARHLYTWDARPYPEFPQLIDVWADGDNWRLGHWVSGRLGAANLNDVVADICEGLDVAIDTSELEGIVWGYRSDQLSSPRDLIDPLAQAYFFDASAQGAEIAFRHRGQDPALTFTQDDLVRNDQAPAFALTRGQESELPRNIVVTFYSPEADYNRGTVESKRLMGSTAAAAELPLPMALPHSRAAGIADAALIQAHVEREKLSFSLPPSALALDAGDVVTITLNGRAANVRLEELGLEHARPARAVRENPRVYDLEDGQDYRRPVPRNQAPDAPTAAFLDLPLLDDALTATAHAPYVAAWGAPWSPVAFYRGADSSSPALDTTLDVAAGLGQLTASLARGPTSHWDEANALTVEMGEGGALSSAGSLAVLNGANIGAVQMASGAWEIVQWRTASLVAPRTYQLTGLLRGLLGTDSDMEDLVPAGQLFVVLDGAVEQTALPLSLARAAQYWTWGPASRPLSSSLYASATLTFKAIGRRPYAPVGIAAARNYAGGSNDVNFSWIRRSRIGNDDWAPADIPLGETSEAYELDVMSGSTVKRTIASSTPSALYTAAQQTTDFGAPPASLDVQVFQLSTYYGRGAGRRVTLNV